MRKAIVALLALTPIVLHAQATPPAPTDTSPQATVLQSKLIQPSEIGAPDIRSANPAKLLRVSTGVAAPKLISTVDITRASDLLWHLPGTEQIIVVEMTVDATGIPTDLKVVESADPAVNSNVLEAVRQYRFKPGTVSGEPTAVPVRLQITMKSPLT